jgi:hypothetical protein
VWWTGGGGLTLTLTSVWDMWTIGVRNFTGAEPLNPGNYHTVYHAIYMWPILWSTRPMWLYYAYGHADNRNDRPLQFSSDHFLLVIIKTRALAIWQRINYYLNDDYSYEGMPWCILLNITSLVVCVLLWRVPEKSVRFRFGSGNRTGTEIILSTFGSGTRTGTRIKKFFRFRFGYPNRKYSGTRK